MQDVGCDGVDTPKPLPDSAPSPVPADDEAPLVDADNAPLVSSIGATANGGDDRTNSPKL